MKKVVAVLGVTGQQGKSVADTILQDERLSAQYVVRGITRDASSVEAKALLSRGADIFVADFNDRSALKKAFCDAHTVFAMTPSVYAADGASQETHQGREIADEAVASGVRHLIYSTVPSPTKITNGKYAVSFFDCKDAVKDYIETLPIMSTFFAPGTFMQNFTGHMKPRLSTTAEAGEAPQYVMTHFLSPSTSLALIDVANDTGKFVGAMLASPEKYAGQTFCAATQLYTLPEVAAAISKATGKHVEYQQVTKDVFAHSLPEHTRSDMVNMFSYFEEFGYFGKDTSDKLGWASCHALAALTSLDDFLAREKLHL